jgi:translation initiation factor eIF-2B subunit beta
MTIGTSKTITELLQRAARRSRFTILIPEHAPSYDGQALASQLRENDKLKDTWVIPDSAVFAVMPRITVVFIPVRAVFVDGTLVVASFTKAVALAARHHAKPFVVIYRKHKLTNAFLKPKDSFTKLASPYAVIGYDDFVAKKAVVLNPDGEIMASKLVSLFINEDDEHGATDIFPAVKNFYEPEGRAADIDRPE